MNVLWCTTHRPDPTAGGGAALEFELVRWASQHHRITVLAIASARAGGTGSVPDLPGVDVVELERAPRPQARTRPALLVEALRGGGVEAFRRCAPWVDALVAAARDRVAGGDVDLVHVSWAELAPVAAQLADSVPTALWVSDSFVRHVTRELAAADTVRQRLYQRLELRNARRWERDWYGRASAVATASAVDSEAMAATAGIVPGVVPVVLGSEWFEAPAGERSATEVAFVGALDYRPNIDAVRWLTRDIWPLVRDARPDAALVVVGRNPVEEVRAAVAAAGGVLHADVPDVRPFLWRAAVAVAPIRLGGGMKNKVLHAFACGAPLVATTAAVEGIEVGEGIVDVVDDPRRFALAVVAALADPAASAARSQKGVEVAARYRVDAVGASLEELWDRALRARRSGSAATP